MTLIRSDMLLFAIRSELDEQRFVLKLRLDDPKADDLEIANITGFIEALVWCQSQVEARAKKAAA